LAGLGYDLSNGAAEALPGEDYLIFGGLVIRGRDTSEGGSAAPRFRRCDEIGDLTMRPTPAIN